ncbi:tRNA guanosine-2'-O-methyltransferase TRM11 [Angomonas deanei]|uniref:RNA methylase family UPF0020, putative n=1 Tax=Angomonas deanei TaxID=59799 RepID=A0A7G2CSV4_9TRYP|nr:tRNA guanosine-2'-O-methyltransferase TRM11 [Angomonas deanei]CAD2222409.1 Putative RNA methylase family UPF0020, putative [Angomonas deanei]|eukprot:EPY29810.1 tRNA guanosine-2'-O-methyltransferase TRM11 [Angomonas deanei]
MKYFAVFGSEPSLFHFSAVEFLETARHFDLPITPYTLENSKPYAFLFGKEAAHFLVFECDNRELLSLVVSRCVLLKAVYVLLHAADTLESLLNRQQPSETLLVGEKESQFEDGDFSYRVETIGKRYAGEVKNEIIKKIVATSSMAADRPVNYTDPKHAYVVFIQHEVENAVRDSTSGQLDGAVLRVLHGVLFSTSNRGPMLHRYDLRRRPYIGTTSMPPEESLLMSNLCGVVRGSVVLDPFCGTGSILVAAAHYGAQTMGTDADGRAMRAGTNKGKVSPQLIQQRKLALACYSAEQLARLTPEELELPDMWTNFKVYGLPPPDRVRMNFSVWQQTWRSEGGLFDAILTDPPYGLREPRKKVGEGEGNKPASYSTHEVVLDLVLFAAEHLVVGGRLAFWHPTTDHYTDDELPSHPSMKIQLNLPQRISLKVVRRLVVMEKTSPPPLPRPTREECAPKRCAEDLHQLMHQTEAVDNEDYNKYREKKKKRWAAAEGYRAQQQNSNGEEDNETEGRPRRRRKVETQEEIVKNRERKIKEREEKQLASQRNNAELHKKTSPS